MSTVLEILKRREEEIKTKNELLETAKKLHLSADALIQKANQPSVHPGNFKALAQAKKERFDKRTDSIEKGTAKEMDSVLNSYGWTLLVFSASNPLQRTYHSVNHPGFHAIFKGNSLTVKFNGESKVKDLYSKDGKTLKLLNPSQFCKVEPK